jgi:hypothetical protein
MTPRLALVGLTLLSLTGCVAALPMAAQLVSGANSSAQLCAMTKMPGQTESLCDRMKSTLAAQMPGQTPAQTSAQTVAKTQTSQPVSTASR